MSRGLCEPAEETALWFRQLGVVMGLSQGRARLRSQFGRLMLPAAWEMEAETHSGGRAAGRGTCGYTVRSWRLVSWGKGEKEGGSGKSWISAVGDGGV
jgi:hypothetical protein